MSKVRARVLAGPLLFAAVSLQTALAHAGGNTVRLEGDHPEYAVELEPHALIAPFYDHGLPGVGARATITLAPHGFIKRLNDSVGLGFGVDWTRDTTWVPVVLQWNFWLSEHWSVFGEPGIALRFRDDFKDRGPDFTIYGGARLRLGHSVALTFRVGRPALTLGVSFFI